ncbi:hypothetical protein A6A08_19145 [Nocardiopsis sp. TSRI0078]|uniref:sugar phosphate isomerase/epimerase family protein n=1 Tax=unclassified Nocardiopsis TaxID=2649073 RepID=UPI000938AFBE|nr:sugar phosphate isomerase/epimerase family protein [Nocardiopsis sp. TSRI0078]OKI22388.1 hypothetical protein A6A08_19145 [Nocardiopsis sp. TSRI0078]
MNGVRVGVADWRLHLRGWHAVDLAARVGADGVHLDLGGPGRGPRIDRRGALAHLRRRSEETGVAVLALTANVLNDIGLTAEPGGTDALRVRRILIRLMDAGHALGAPLVFVPSFRRSAIGGPSDLRRTIDVLRWAAPEAAARGLLLASENVLAPDQAGELVEGVGSPVFRLLLDTWNPRAAGVDPLPLVRDAAPHWADQVHLKEADGGTVGRAPLGRGHPPAADVLRALTDHGVRIGALVLENDYRDGDTARLAHDTATARRYADALPGPRPTEPLPEEAR